MTAMTAARLRALRAAIVAPNLSVTDRRLRTWRYVDAEQKTSPGSWLWARLCDIATRRYDEAQMDLLREACADAERARGGL